MARKQLSGIIRLVAPFLFSFGALIMLTAPTLRGVSSRWLKFDESYSHGFLLLTVVVFITARKWKTAPPIPGLYVRWLAPLVFCLVGYVIGGVLRVEALQQLVLIPLWLSALAVLVGWAQGSRFILPISLLFFAMPFWDYLSWSLQLVTVAINEIGLGLLGINFRIDGIYVYLTGVGAFEVAHGCSGLRYLLVGQSLAMLYGELNFKTISSRIYLYLVAVFLALFANWLRVLIIIYMGHETNMESSLIDDHENFGWLVFGATLIPLFMLGRRLEVRKVEQDFQVQHVDRVLNNSSANPRWAGSLAILGLLFVSWLSVPEYMTVNQKASDEYELSLDGKDYGPAFLRGIKGWRPDINNADRVFQQTLFDRQEVRNQSSADPTIYHVSIHSYDFQRHGAEVIQYSNRNYDPQQWHPTDLFTIEGPNGYQLNGVSLEHRLTQEQVHVAYGYYVEGFWESEKLRAKLSQIAGLFNARTDASQITFGVGCKQCDPIEALGSLVDAELPTLISTIDSQYRP